MAASFYMAEQHNSNVKKQSGLPFATTRKESFPFKDTWDIQLIRFKLDKKMDNDVYLLYLFDQN